MPLHPVLADKMHTALAPSQPLTRTRRDARLPVVPGKVHSVIGMRRAGKTTFLHQLLDERRSALPPERALYIGFDDDRLAGIEVDQLGFLLEEYYRNYPALRSRETVHWFLDEIQLVPGWERFCRRVLDTEKVELVVSGSSARMLSREVHTSLRGRGMPTVIRPFSFREFLRHRGEEPAEGAWRPTPGERSLVEQGFREFLVEGGFPEAQGLSAAVRIELLQGYVDTVLFRDVVERYKVFHVEALRCSAGWCVNACAIRPGVSARTGCTSTSERRGTAWARRPSTPCSRTSQTLSCSPRCHSQPIRSASATRTRERCTPRIPASSKPSTRAAARTSAMRSKRQY
jgi:hypothetical protein